MLRFLKLFDPKKHRPKLGGLEIFRFIGPGLLVTVGFIDPGNWASNLSAGANYGYALLWIVSLGTVMLIILQHNVAHLGIVSGLCLAEAATKFIHPGASKLILGSAMMASISTSLAEILGSAIALNMIFDVPVRAGSLMVAVFVIIMLFTNTYRIIERWIIGFVSIIGISFVYELSLVKIDWDHALRSWVVPSFPEGSILVIMSVLGAVVMPHNLFLHSEVIQSRQWNLENEKIIKKQLDYEFLDTIFSMLVGWAINSALILLAASAFFSSGTEVTELQQAKQLLEPLLGGNAAVIFAVALLFSGLASTITSGIAAGTIMAGISSEPYDINDNHSRLGVVISLAVAVVIIFLISNPFNGLIISQVVLSMQLPFTVFLQVRLTSSEKVMGRFKNSLFTKYLLYILGGIVTLLNLYLLLSLLNI